MGIARLSIIFAFLTGFPAMSHEFWIQPEQYQVDVGDPIIATLRNGQNFKGTSLAWFDSRFTRFDMISNDNVQPVLGRLGDTPALQADAGEDGLLVVVHETVESTLTYQTWDKFLTFVDHKDFRTAVATHEAHGWPKEQFRETYTRHVKSLIAIGTGKGEDRAFGLQTEFVALTNPYEDDFDGNMQVLVRYQGDPRPDAQVEVFARSPDGSVDVTLHRTNDKGVAQIAVLPGYQYLFDAVVLRPSPRAGTEEKAPLWETLWAALTFEVPSQ
ncbi:MAG: DUF4198 domain-containing protein [Roseobacter sp.]